MSTIKLTPSHAKGLCYGIFRPNRLVENCVSGDHMIKNSHMKVTSAALLSTLANPRYFTFHQAYKRHGIWSKYKYSRTSLKQPPKMRRFSGRWRESKNG